jgi:hypothetical protein
MLEGWPGPRCTPSQRAAARRGPQKSARSARSLPAQPPLFHAPRTQPPALRNQPPAARGWHAPSMPPTPAAGMPAAAPTRGWRVGSGLERSDRAFQAALFSHTHRPPPPRRHATNVGDPQPVHPFPMGTAAQHEQAGQLLHPVCGLLLTATAFLLCAVWRATAASAMQQDASTGTPAWRWRCAASCRTRAPHARQRPPGRWTAWWGQAAPAAGSMSAAADSCPALRRSHPARGPRFGPRHSLQTASCAQPPPRHASHRFLCHPGRPDIRGARGRRLAG